MREPVERQARREPTRRRPSMSDSAGATQEPVRSPTPGSDAARRIRDERSGADRSADDARGDTSGLSAAEVDARRQRYGANAIEERRPSILSEVASHFWGPIPWMIEAALVLTAATTRWTDFAIILALLLLNGVVGFWEEHQAQGAIEALKGRLAKQAKVHRDGTWTSVPAEDLVPGDLIAVERGEIVPADASIVDGRGETDESTLTGESLPVEKHEGDDLYSGSILVRGGPVARVLATGEATLFGRTADLAEMEPPPSHLQQAIVSIGKYLIVVAAALVLAIVVVSLLRGESATSTMEFALVVTIASIPVALPAVLSVTLAVGARQLARHEAVVSHLPAVEEMAGVDVLCADKTGTITKNEIAVADVVSLDGETDADVLLQAALTTEPGSGDPMDRAILELVDADMLRGYQVLDLEPFDPTRKRAEAHVRGPDGSEFDVAKGAVQSILELAGPNGDVADRLGAMTHDFAGKGYRALAVARAGNGRWEATGGIGLQDPPRDDSGETIAEAQRLGLEVKLVTGDRVEIARQIAGQVGMGTDILEADALAGDDGSIAPAVERSNGFAEVVPEDKYRIVERLQGLGHIVGMTGDGVNDVPALKRAEAGIAVSGATDAARAAADIVLLAPGLSTIVEAIHQAREVFQRMKNYAIYRITETIRIVFFVTVSILVFGFYPVTPIQVVLLAILNDGAILSIAYDRVRGSSRPVRWDLKEVLILATVLGLAGLIASFGMLWISHVALGLNDAEVQTMLYLKLSVAGHLTVFVARTHDRFWTYRPAGILVASVIGTQLLATVIAVYGVFMQPIGWELAGLCWGYALVWFLVLDEVKVVTYATLERRGLAAEELAVA